MIALRLQRGRGQVLNKRRQRTARRPVAAKSSAQTDLWRSRDGVDRIRAAGLSASHHYPCAIAIILNHLL